MSETCGRKHLYTDEHTGNCRIDLAPVDPSTLPDPRPDNPLEALSWLGDTVEAVAEGLRARAIKGKRASPWSCPLARYLQEWWPHATVAMGYSDTKWIRRKGNISTPLPAPVNGFERKFDRWGFPDLIDSDG